MNPEAITELITRQPFEPFTLILSSGERVDIRHPELAAVAKTRMVVTIPETDGLQIVSLFHITSILTMQKA